MYHVKHLIYILLILTTLISESFSDNKRYNNHALSSSYKEHNLSDETIANVMMIITQFLINEPSTFIDTNTTDNNTSTGSDTNTTDSNTTSGSDSNTSTGSDTNTTDSNTTSGNDSNTSTGSDTNSTDSNTTSGSDSNTSTGSDTNTTDSNTTSGGDTNSTDSSGNSTANAINTQLLTKVSTQFNTITNVIAIENNGSIQFTTQLLGKDVNITAFDVGTSGAYAFVTQISAPFYEILEIDNDTWLDDPTTIDRSSTTRKLYLDDLGFSQTKTFIFVSQDLNLTQDNVPTPVKDILAPINGNSFSIACQSGLSIHDKIALDNIPEIERTLNFLAFSGGSLGGILYPETTYNMSTIVTIPLNNLYTPLWQKAIVPTFEFHTAIDNFDLQFGDYVQFTLYGLLDPLTIQPILNVTRDAQGFNVSIDDSRVEMPITTLSVNCYLRIYLKTSPIEVDEKRVSITIKNNEDWPIFGAKWLSFAPDSYGLHLQVPQTDAILNIKHLAQTELLGKYVIYQETETLYAGSSFSKLSPPSQGFVLHDGPGKIGEVPIYWFAQLMEYILQVSGANVDLNLVTNIISPLKLKGILPQGETIANYEKQLGHPIGPQFELFPNPNGIPGVNFDGALTLFDIPKPLATVNRFAFSTTNGIDIQASTTDFTLGDGSLFTMPNFELRATVPGLKDLIGALADAPVDSNHTFGQNVITAVEDSAVDIATLYNNIEVKLVGDANVLTAQANLEFIITPRTQYADFLMNFAGITTNTSLYQSSAPWDPGISYEMSLDTTELSGWANSGADYLRSQINSLFDDINNGIANTDNAIAQAQADLDTAIADLNRITAQAQAHKDNAERELNKAIDAVNAAKNDLENYDYDMYYSYSNEWTGCVDTFLFGRKCIIPPERWAQYAPWQAGRGIYTGALSVAEFFLSELKKTIKIIPVDAYPEVIAAKANVILAEQNLAAAEALAVALDAISSGLQDALNYATNAVDNLFQLLEFNIYGGLGFNSSVGIMADVILFGQSLTLNESVGSDLYYLRDNFFDILNEEIWQPISEMIVNESLANTATTVYANQGIVSAPPVGSIPDMQLIQDNAKECNLTQACYTIDIAPYISDADTNQSELRYSAINLPKHLKMDLHGNITGALSRADVGLHTVTVTVVDPTFNKLETSFDLNITGRNTPHTVKVITQHQYIDSQNFDSNNTDALVSTYATIKADANASSYTELARVLVEDIDIGDGYTFELVSGNTDGHFSIDSQGIISLNQLAEGNILNNYQLTIRVTDTSTFTPQHIAVETDFTIDIMPIVWLEQNNTTITGKTPTYAVRISPVPSSNNYSTYYIDFNITEISQPTNDQNNTVIIQRSIDLSGTARHRAERPLEIATNNRQIDRQYRVEITNVSDGAFIDQSRKSVELNVYALQDMVNILPLNNTVPKRFSKLDIDGNLLADSASDWACIKDNQTGLMWASHNRIKNNTQEVFAWDNSYHTSYGYNLLDLSSRSTYCGSPNVNIPTTTELQSIIDYTKPQEMINTNYFPNINFNKPYMALNIDKAGTSQHQILWTTINREALFSPNPLIYYQLNNYLTGLYGNSTDALFELPRSDTPEDLAYIINSYKHDLNTLFSSINLNTGTITYTPISYITNHNSYILAPYLDNEIIYVIYPDTYPNGENKLLDKNIILNALIYFYSSFYYVEGGSL